MRSRRVRNIAEACNLGNRTDTVLPMARANRQDDDEWTRALGATLLAILHERDQTIKWLAVTAGMDPGTGSKKLHGHIPITIDQVAWMAEALGMSRRALLTRAGFIDVDEDALDVSALSPDGRDSVLSAYQGVLAGMRRRQSARDDGGAEDS